MAGANQEIPWALMVYSGLALLAVSAVLFWLELRFEPSTNKPYESPWAETD